ncbi:MAG: hypothetical protein RJAPGHWK_002940, partial [Candidatus Fervidibacter sp.]
YSLGYLRFEDDVRNKGGGRLPKKILAGP